MEDSLGFAGKNGFGIKNLEFWDGEGGCGRRLDKIWSWFTLLNNLSPSAKWITYFRSGNELARGARRVGCVMMAKLCRNRKFLGRHICG